MTKYIIHAFIIFGSLLPIELIFADGADQKPSLIKNIADTYLTSTFGAKSSIASSAQSKDSTFSKKNHREFDSKYHILTPRETQEVTFDLAASTNTFMTTIVDYSYIEKLNIVNGGEDCSRYLLSIIGENIHTSAGIAHTAFSLCHLTRDIHLLRNRQSAILLLNRDKSLIQNIDIHLKKIKQNEQKSLIAWSSKNPVNKDILDFFYFGKSIDYKNTLKKLNTNTLLLEFTNKTMQLGRAAISIGLPFGIGYKAYTDCCTLLKNKNLTYQDIYDNVQTLTPDKMILLKSISIGIPSIFLAGVSFYIYITIKELQAISATTNYLQDMLIHVAFHVKALKRLSSLINQNKKLLTHLPSLQPLADFNNRTKHSAKLNKLLGMLDTNTFKGEASFFSITGRVLAAYELMKQVKDELAPVLAAAGELDMYVALAKLYNSREGKEARYCMVEFIENSTTPLIKAEKFWNPFINPDTVVINDATFDSSCPNSILTGPNTGGKSTVIKAIMLDVLMAQTFGIAPAKRLVITPFAKLNCFMNISDDIATGVSLFKSEVMRAKKLLDLVQSLKNDEFSFVIIDEVFTGTSPQEGEQAALQFAKKIGTYSNNISIIATHYPKMTDLETETNGIYRNHHVEVLRNEDNSLKRTFKLKNGPSFLNVAFDILEEEELFV